MADICSLRQDCSARWYVIPERHLAAFDKWDLADPENETYDPDTFEQYRIDSLESLRFVLAPANDVVDLLRQAETYLRGFHNWQVGLKPGDIGYQGGADCETDGLSVLLREISAAID